VQSVLRLSVWSAAIGCQQSRRILDVLIKHKPYISAIQIGTSLLQLFRVSVFLAALRNGQGATAQGDMSIQISVSFRGTGRVAHASAQKIIETTNH